MEKRKNKKEKVAAIVPAYNEGRRIERVLRALASCRLLDEIIVVDDCSKDNTRQIVKKFKKVKYIRNNRNLGKSISMKNGIKHTNAKILFFCDADLTGLTPEIVEGIIRPVLERRYSMFIGMRNYKRNKIIIKLGITFLLLSGERAIRRNLWDELPDYYKHGYKIETGLNYFSKFNGNSLGYKVFPHRQIIKEKKYGLMLGEILRWRMNKDVIAAFLRANLSDKIRGWKPLLI